MNYDGSVQGFQRNMKAVHIGAKGERGIVNYQIKASRKISVGDNIVYKAMIGRKSDKIDMNLFIVNNGINSGLGMNLNYAF